MNHAIAEAVLSSSRSVVGRAPGRPKPAFTRLAGGTRTRVPGAVVGRAPGRPKPADTRLAGGTRTRVPGAVITRSGRR